MKAYLLPLLLSALAVAPACSQSHPDRPKTAAARPGGPRGAANYPEAQPVTGKAGEFPVQKTEAEWRQQLTPAQYYILRQEGTERAYSNPLYKEHAAGNFYCAADHNLLFTSATKFDSGTGWPSFWAPASAASLKVKSDRSFGMQRDAIVCAKCGGHLGHVFNDGPAPTGQRYCMDGDALVFEKK